MPNTTIELPDDLPDGNPHYVQAVTELGNEQEVVAQEDIYASNGMKLVAKGTRVNSDMFERLVKHKLKAPLDLQLAAEKQIDAATLAVEASRLLEEDGLMQRLTTRTGDVLRMKHGFAHMTLPPPLNFRLTVMQSRRADLFRHSLRCGLIAQAIAIRLKLPEAEQEATLLAAICHDLGEMHTDPALLVAGRTIAPSERRYIHVHPITSYVLLRELAAPPMLSMNAVLQHHERLDGSGYPYGLTDTRITRLGRLLAVVEVSETVLRRFDPLRLDILLRLNHGRFDAEVIGALRDLLRNEIQGGDIPAEENALRQLEQVRDMLRNWDNFHDFFERHTDGKPAQRGELDFLFTRMKEFRSRLHETGIDFDDLDSNLNLASDAPEIMSEIRTVSEELLWRMKEVANEIEQRSPKLDELSQITLGNFIDALRPDGGPSTKPD